MLRRFAKLADALAIFAEKEGTLPVPQWLEINPGCAMPEEGYVVPKTIWMYWDSPEIPELVDVCRRRVQELCPDYRLHFLNAQTLGDYITLPEVRADLPKANYADLVRFALLAQYGGFWLDASVLLLTDLDWIVSRMRGQEAFLFYSDECTQDLSRPISENWMIAAPRHSPFMQEWLEEYSRCLASEDPKRYYSTLDNYEYHVQNLTKPEYLLPYVSAIVVLNRRRCNILYVSSASSGHYFNYKYRWNDLKIALRLLVRRRLDTDSLRLIKFNSTVRKASEWLIAKRLFRRNSEVGQHLRR
ncbi:glycosyltransferase family 32 protein [Novosphingobium sp. 9]|uniref:glycosyltransferase family 32 protein n=1 Tax=Novosphingobium sp. 9 TaxID=2025349 RepID=UPI0021B6C914|nr:capsular polysaccharide synthesis protein [Novosphingobium sp. 9]